MRAQVPANTGKTIERLWRHSDAYKYKYKDNCADRTPALSELHYEDISYFKENFYLCIIRKEIFKKHTEKDSVFAVGSATQFWTNCKYTGDNAHERLRFAWA